MPLGHVSYAAPTRTRRTRPCNAHGRDAAARPPCLIIPSPHLCTHLPSVHLPLHPGEHLASTPRTASYVRQDSALGGALHGGRLTTSRLKDAMGLRDGAAARLVGGPQVGRGSRGAGREAVMHL